MDPTTQNLDIPQFTMSVDDLSVTAEAEGPINSALRVIALHNRDRNAEYADTSCFPVEILERIFLSYAHRVIDQRDTFAPNHILSISQVCHLWHEIVLRYPDYWTFLPLHYHTWCWQILERSGDHLITAWFRIEPSKQSVALSQSLLLQILPRVDTLCLEIHGGFDAYRRFLETSITKTKKASKLRSLKIISDQGTSRHRSLFHKYLPCLQHLDLSECFYELEWTSTYYFRPTLTYLSLKANLRASDRRLYETLRNLSNLQVLRLDITEDITERLNTDDDPNSHLSAQTDQLVPLRALRILEMAGNIRSCLSLVNRLLVQPGLSPRFKFPLPTEKGEQVHQTLFGKEVTHFVSWLKENYCPHLTNEPSKTPTFERPLFSFGYTWNSCLCHGWQRDLNLFYLPIFLHLPLSNVRVLTVSRPSEIGLSSTIQLEHFRELAIMESGGVMFFRWFTTTRVQQESGSERATSHLLPALKELRIVGLNLAYEGLGKLVEEIVQQRRASGHPLESVSLHDCDDISGPWVESMTNLGVVLTMTQVR